MALPEEYYSDPFAVVGRSFELTSGFVFLQRSRGTVLEVQEAPNAVGRIGYVVIHTLPDGKTYRTAWSYFREHATMVES